METNTAQIISAAELQEAGKDVLRGYYKNLEKHIHIGKSFEHAEEVYLVVSWSRNGWVTACKLNPDPHPTCDIQRLYSFRSCNIRLLDGSDMYVPENNRGHVFMRDLITKYHPRYSLPGLSQNALNYPKDYNIEHLVEQCIAHVGNLTFEDAEGYDFIEDKSDSKTTSINVNTRVAEISSVENKIGALRICAYNPFADRIDYFFIPADKVKYASEPCYGKFSFKERIKFRYSSEYDGYGWIDEFRVDSFENLAKKR